MAEEKKPTNLKDRLKKTQVGGAGAPAGGAVVPPGGAGVVPPVVADMPTPTAAADAGSAPVAPPIAPPIAAPPIAGIPGIPGISSDVAPPPFVQEQMRQEEERKRQEEERRRQEDERKRRAAAAAADPFGASSTAVAAPTELKLVALDGSEIKDDDVGRTKTGSILAIVATGAIALGLGFLMGGQYEQHNQATATLSALGEIRREVTRAGEVIGTMRQKIDAAARRAGFAAQQAEGEGQAAAPAGPTEVDTELLAFFRENSDVPFTPQTFAGRAGRLTGQLTQKLSVFALQTQELWNELRVHNQRTNAEVVRAAMRTPELGRESPPRYVLTFVPNPQNQGPVPVLGVLNLPANQRMEGAGPFPVLVDGYAAPAAAPAAPAAGAAPAAPAAPAAGAAATPPPLQRSPWTGAPLNAQNAMTTMIPLPHMAPGLTRRLGAAERTAWLQYRERLGEIKRISDELGQSLQQLQTSLTPGGGGGGH